MNNKLRYNLNLASHPLRNRRLFFAPLLVLGIAFVCLSAWSCFTYIKFKSKSADIKTEIASTNSLMRDFQNEQAHLNKQIEDLNL